MMLHRLRVVPKAYRALSTVCSSTVRPCLSMESSPTQILDHVLRCASCAGPNLRVRHEAILRVLRDTCTEYSVPCSLISSKTRREDHSIPDALLSERDSFAYIDATVFHQPMEYTGLHDNAVCKAANAKVEQHRNFLEDVQPFASSSYGVPTTSTLRILRGLDRISQYPGFMSTFMNRTYVSLAKSHSLLLSGIRAAVAKELVVDAHESVGIPPNILAPTPVDFTSRFQL